MSVQEARWILAKRKLTIKEIQQVETSLGLSLPKDYVECVLQHNGGQPVPDIFEFEGRPGAVFNALIHIHTEEAMHLLEVCNRLKGRLPDEVFPFANDPFGNYICFDYRYGNTPVIVFWDHEAASRDSKTALSFICNSFTELLLKLHD